MNKNKRQVDLSHYELVDIIKIISTMENAEKQKPNANNNEIDLLHNLKNEIIDNTESTVDCCKLTLDNEQFFAIWLCLDTYLSFCKSIQNEQEINHCQNLMNKVSSDK